MKRVIIVAMLYVVGFVSYAQVKPEMQRTVVLPNAKLLRCTSSDCSELWESTPPRATDIHPYQVTVDLLKKKHCPLGILARYDKSVSEEELRAAINDRYGKWATGRNLWRVESEGFTILLATVNKGIARDLNEEEVGTRHVIYTALKWECNAQQ